jgi:(E)-4-hydroxy-3-methylbut-2-enyl-diphosphate synthase
MTNTKTSDIPATVNQILRMEAAGCDIVRAAVPDMEAARAFSKIKESIHIPFVADIHFDYRLAIEAVAAGADKIRINPGNIGAPERVKAVADACRNKGVPIRIGINSGSMDRKYLQIRERREVCDEREKHVCFLTIDLTI